MNREPTPKSQAKIVRRVFAEHGVDLAHRQALDVVAQVHGHASWQVMQAQLPKATPAPAQPTAQQVKVPRRENILVPVMPNASPARATENSASPHVFSFEGIAFLATREEFDSLVDDETRAQRLFAEMKDQLAAFGITALESVYVSEDDEQDDEDIKVFVGVTLRGNCRWEENERPPYDLEDMLERLAIAACCDKEGNQLAHPDDWELLSIDDAEDA